MLCLCAAALVPMACGDDRNADPPIEMAQAPPSYQDDSAFSGRHQIDDEPPAMPGQYRTRRIVELDEGLEAVNLVAHPGLEDTLLVVERSGLVLELRGDELAAEPWLDLTESIDSESNYERGLLGLALSETHAYLYYTDLEGHSNVVQHELDDDGRPDTEREDLLLHVEQPAGTHNGGMLQLDERGYLWVAFGDGGVGAPSWNAQDPTTLLGSILRIRPTPDGEQPYAIPADNPFVGDSSHAPEIWVYGLRNPWSFWFDDRTGALWVADVGQAEHEEVDLLRHDESGANLGWPWYEGYDPYTPDPDFGAEPDQGDEPPEDRHDPLLAYHHSALGCAIVGGEVARDGPDRLEGAYLFGDLCDRRVVALWPDGADRDEVVEVVATAPADLTSIGVIDGDVYLTTREPGGVHVLERGSASDRARRGG